MNWTGLWFDLICDAGTMAAYLILLRGNFRCSIQWIFLSLVAVNLISDLIKNAGVVNIPVEILLTTAFYAVYMSFIRENRINSWILWCGWNLIYQIMANVTIGILYFIWGVIHGGGWWFSREESGLAGLVIQCLAMLAGMAISLWVMRKLEEDVLILDGALQKFLFFVLVICDIGLFFIKDSFVAWTSSDIDIQGTAYGIDTIRMGIALIGFVVLTVYSIRQRKGRKQAILEELDHLYGEYHQIEESRQRIRMLHHEMKNVGGS